MAISVIRFFGAAVLVLVLAWVIKTALSDEGGVVSAVRSRSGRNRGRAHSSCRGSIGKKNRPPLETVITEEDIGYGSDRLMIFKLDNGESVGFPVSYYRETILGREDLDSGNTTISRKQLSVREENGCVRVDVIGRKPLKLLAQDGRVIGNVTDSIMIGRGETLYFMIGDQSFAARLFPAQESVKIWNRAGRTVSAAETDPDYIHTGPVAASRIIYPGQERRYGSTGGTIVR